MTDEKAKASPEAEASATTAESKPRVRRIVRSSTTAEAAKPDAAPAAAPAAADKATPADKPAPTRTNTATATHAADGTTRWSALAPRTESRPRAAGGQGGGRPQRPRFEPARPRRPGEAPASWTAATQTDARAARPEGEEARGPRPGPRGPRSEGRGPRPEGRGPRPEGRGPRPDSRGPRPEGRGPRPEGRDERARPQVPQAAAKPAPRPAAPLPVKAAAPARTAPPPLPIGRAKPVHAKATKPAMTAKEALRAKTAKAAKQAASVGTTAGVAERTAVDEALLSDLAKVGYEGAAGAIERVGEGAEALIDRWLAGSNAAAIAAVADHDGPARKLARRALGVLKARGVSIPEPPKKATGAVSASESPTIEATMLPPDASGTGSFSITVRDPGGRFHLAEVIVREPVGVVHAGSGWLSGNKLKAARARAEQSVGVAPVAVPVEWARYRIEEARKLNAASGQVLPLGFDACRELFAPVPASEPTHPLADLDAKVTAELSAERAPKLADLHEEPEFQRWLPDRGAIDEMLRQVGERPGPEGLSDPKKVDETMREEMDAATDRFFTPEVREIIAKRLRDCAVSVRVRRGDERALDVLAVAKAILEAGLITSPPREIPFLIAYFQKAISWLLHQGGGQLRIPVRSQAAAG